MSTLEVHYRRLLRAYPRAHRAEHEDEMLGVLLAAADDGQRRPTARDTWDLTSGGLRVRLRRVPLGNWSEALPVTAFLAIVLVLAVSTNPVTLLSRNLQSGGEVYPATLSGATAWGLWAVALLVGTLGVRILAIAVTWAATVTTIVHFGVMLDLSNGDPWYETVKPLPLFLALTAVLAVTVSGGVSAGLARLGGSRWTWLTFAALLVAFGRFADERLPLVDVPLAFLLAAVAAGAAAGRAVVGPMLWLLAGPLVGWMFDELVPFGAPSPGTTTASYSLPLAMLAITLVLVWWSGRRPRVASTS